DLVDVSQSLGSNPSSNASFIQDAVFTKFAIRFYLNPCLLSLKRLFQFDDIIPKWDGSQLKVSNFADAVTERNVYVLNVFNVHCNKSRQLVRKIYYFQKTQMIRTRILLLQFNSWLIR